MTPMADLLYDHRLNQQSGILEMQKPTLTPLILVFVFALLIIGATLLLGLALTESPRGFMTWALIGFICWFEFVFAMLAGHFLWVKGKEQVVSGAMMAIVFKVAGSYTVIGILTVLLFAIIPGQSDQRDKVFAALMFLESAIFFAIGVALYYSDLHQQKADAPALEQREQHAVKAFTLQGVLQTMRSVRVEDTQFLGRHDALMKKIERAEQALAHSHGGGVLSNLPDPRMFEEQVSSAVDGLSECSSSLVHSQDNMDEVLQTMDGHITQLNATLTAARLF